MDSKFHYILVLQLITLSIAIIEGSHCDQRENILNCASGESCYSHIQKCNGVPDCPDGSDEANCTSPGNTKHIVITEKVEGNANLAFLVTPAVFVLGILYLIYKCAKDGLCNPRQLRQRAAQAARRSGGSDYYALDFYSMTRIPCNQLGLDPEQAANQRLMLVHNHSVTLAMRPTSMPAPPSYDEAVTSGQRNVAFLPLLQEEDAELPPYSEAVASGTTVSSPTRSGASVKGVAFHIEEEEEAHDTTSELPPQRPRLATLPSIWPETEKKKSRTRVRHKSGPSKVNLFVSRPRQAQFDTGMARPRPRARHMSGPCTTEVRTAGPSTRDRHTSGPIIELHSSWTWTSPGSTSNDVGLPQTHATAPDLSRPEDANLQSPPLLSTSGPQSPQSCPASGVVSKSPTPPDLKSPISCPPELSLGHRLQDVRSPSPYTSSRLTPTTSCEIRDGYSMGQSFSSHSSAASSTNVTPSHSISHRLSNQSSFESTPSISSEHNVVVTSSHPTTPCHPPIRRLPGRSSYGNSPNITPTRIAEQSEQIFFGPGMNVTPTHTRTLSFPFPGTTSASVTPPHTPSQRLSGQSVSLNVTPSHIHSQRLSSSASTTPSHVATRRLTSQSSTESTSSLSSRKNV